MSTAQINAIKPALRAFLDAEREFREAQDVANARRLVMNVRKAELIQSFQTQGVTTEATLNLPDARKVEYLQVATRGGVTKKLLTESLAEFVASHKLRVDPKEAVEFIWNRRASGQAHWDVQLKMPKASSEEGDVEDN